MIRADRAVRYHKSWKIRDSKRIRIDSAAIQGTIAADRAVDHHERNALERPVIDPATLHFGRVPADRARLDDESSFMILNAAAIKAGSVATDRAADYRNSAEKVVDP